MASSHDPETLKRLGAAWLAIGAAFLALAFTVQFSFLAVGCAFFCLGVVFLAKARKDNRR
ncbi:hypothetical protein [Thermomonas sp.]|uniref:hypothetical protein n=1 Tax=Thermomonas sp. TaxID=1971895 RepID=UPI002B6108BC|nr:hypothetical protein [Thermomonas sp.]HRO63258.1 hypothetical protein [Thermomonas sp.]